MASDDIDAAFREKTVIEIAYLKSNLKQLRERIDNETKTHQQLQDTAKRLEELAASIQPVLESYALKNEIRKAVLVRIAQGGAWATMGAILWMCWQFIKNRYHL